MKDKEQAYFDFLKMVKRSWTYARMTEQEQEKCVSALRFGVEQGLVAGRYEQRWGQLQAIQHAFLLGIGYDGAFWRESRCDDVPFCVGISA